jgi:predicted DNA-binding mobile mystery protein A
MKRDKNRLVIEQLDRKIKKFGPIGTVIVPVNGWINAIRTAVRMSLQQLGDKLSITPQSVKEIEQREANGSITLNSLREVAEAMDMKLVYGFIPKEQTIEKWIDKKAYEAARKIVMRTSNTMRLEDQENAPKRIEKAIRERAEDIKNELPKYLWN